MGEVRFSLVLLVWFGLVFNYIIDDNDGGTEGGYPKPPPLPIPSMIDIYTPAEAKTRKGFDGQAYELVFSDEFEVDGRSFYKGASKSFFWVFEFLFACFWRCFFLRHFFFLGNVGPISHWASILSYLLPSLMQGSNRLTFPVL